MRIWSGRKKAQKLSPKIGLGRSWAQFGMGLGHSGASFAHFWAHVGRFLDVQNHYPFETLVQHELQEAFGVDLESLLDDFGMVLGGLWKGLGRVWEALGKTWKDAWGFLQGILVSSWLPLGVFLIDHFGFYDPRAGSPTRLASQCAGIVRAKRVLN